MRELSAGSWGKGGNGSSLILASKDPNNAERIKKRQNLTINEKEKIRMLRQLASALDAGIPLKTFFDSRLKNLELIQQGVSRKQFVLGGDVNDGPFIAEVADLLENGYSFGRICELFPRIFSQSSVVIIKAAEEGGKLTPSVDKKTGEYKRGVLEVHVDHLEEKRELKSKFKSKMISPAFFFVVVGFVMYLAFNHIVPKFAELYAALLGGRAQLNLVTQSLIWVAEFFRDWFLLVAGFSISFTIAYVILRRKTAFIREFESMVALQLPVIEKYVVQTSAFNWLTTIWILKDSGGMGSLTSQMEEAARSIENRTLRKAAFEAAKIVENDKEAYAFDAMAKSTEYFGRASTIYRVQYQYWKNTGNTNELEAFLIELRKDLRSTQDALLALVEPVMLCIAAPITLWIVLGLYLPLFELVGKFASK